MYKIYSEDNNDAATYNIKTTGWVYASNGY